MKRASSSTLRLIIANVLVTASGRSGRRAEHGQGHGDGHERRAQFVAEHGQEMVLGRRPPPRPRAGALGFPLGFLEVVDVRGAAEPAEHAARLVLERHVAPEVPAVRAVSPAQAVFGVEDFPVLVPRARRHFSVGGGQVVGVGDGLPAGAVGLLEGKARVLDTSPG